jgi:tRNA A-37 threonylcarbamoyl transferase component Bud32
MSNFTEPNSLASNFLYQFKQPCPADFALQLADSSVFTCQQVVRIVPQKRLVCRGLWQGRAVYAKLFIGSNADKYARRDANGLALLGAAKINTPQLLYQGEALDKSTQVLIFVAIEPADTAEAVWPTISHGARFALAKKLVAEVAQHHNAGLLQTDLYLKNFLVADETIYTLDGDGIRQFIQLKDDQALQNLAILLSKFDVLHIEKWQKELAEIYSDTRTWRKVAEPKKLAAAANLHRLKAASNYADKKVFRQCTDVNVATKSSALGGLFYAASSDTNTKIPTNIADLDALMQPQKLLKSGNTCTVALAEISGKKIVIKRYNIKNFWHGLSRAFRQTRAAVSWANAHRLMLLNIATAKPIALIESRKFGCLRGKAFFLAEYIDAPDVAQYFAQTQNKTERADAVKNIVTLFYRLYLLQISHGDTKATNIKMVDNKPVLIDLDSMQQHSTYARSSVAHLRDLNRFMQNWQNEPALYNAFVKTFKVVYPDISILVKAGIGQNIDMFKEINNQ